MSSFEKFVMGSLLGLGVGAVVGMLLAPRKGEETRHLIREDLARRVATSKEKMASTAQDMAHNAQDVARKVSSDVKSKVATLSDKAREISTDLENVGRKTIERFDSAVDNAANGAKTTKTTADATPY